MVIGAMGIRRLNIIVAAARGTAAVAACLLLANCASSGKFASRVDPKYGVSSSPRVVGFGEPVPKGGGTYRIGKPYTVAGRVYVPEEDPNYRAEGMASWYGDDFHGRLTANGEVFDMTSLTAAHPTLPIPSYARVTNVKNGQSVVVRVNDRGPFHSNRIIDLSYAAAARIGIVNSGSGLVDVERIVPGPGVSDQVVAATPPQTAMVETPMISREASRIWLQLGAFSSLESAESFRDRVARDLPWMLEPVSIAAHDGLHRVRLGPYRNVDEATAIGDKVRRSLGVAPVMMQR